ncbi:MAG TPA: hypothetical protein VF784_07265 [Anaerolineales bacterium]
MIHNPKKVFLLYLAALSLAGAATIYLATSRQGPGVSTDAAIMLSASGNLLKGLGLVDYRGFVLTQYPPLYSLLLALGSLLFRQTPFVVSWALTGIVFAAIVWFSGLYFYAAFEEARLLAYFAAFIVFSSTSLIEISSNAASDPLFLLIALGFLLLATAYLRSHDGRYLIGAGVLTVLACFERYAGLSLVITGAFLIALDGRKDLRKAILLSAAFAVCTALPIFLWGYLHNAPVNGTIFGSHQPADPVQDFATGVEKVLYWFIPYRIISFVGPVLLFALILGVWLLLLLLTTRSLRVFQNLLTPQLLPSAVFLVVYGAMLIFKVSTYELKALTTDRIHIIALPSLLIVGGSLFMPLLAASLRKLGGRPVVGLAMLLFVAWSVYPLSKTQEYLQKSIANGDASAYNLINKGSIRTSALAKYLGGLAASPKTIYTNGSARAWFIMDRQVEPSPLLQPNDRLNYLENQYAHWPGAGQSVYVVWFHSEEYKTLYATPKELQAVANLQQIYADADGAVYLATSR